MTHVRFSHRGAAASALTAALLGIILATPALASTTASDPRWLPWIGCWTPTTATSEIAASLSVAQRVCVMPADSGTGVDVVGVVDGTVISRVRVDATGERRPVSREGCAGWETARWSSVAGRVFLRSELTCAGGVKRVASGIIAIASPSDWVDVEVVSVNDQRATRIIRYRSAPDSTMIDREIAAAIGDQEMARRAARMAAAALPGISDVIEASRELDPAVVEAWLLQRMPRFTVEARELRQLASARVPGSVIDLVVALSRPEMFQDRLATRGYTLVRVDAPRPIVVALESQAPPDEYVASPATGSVGGGVYEGYSSWPRGGRCSRCSGREIIYYDSNPYSSYGYYPYWPYGLYPLYPVYPSYPYPYPYPRPPQQQKPASRPPVIVHDPPPRPVGQQPTTPAPDPVNGRAIKGTGYTRSTGSGTATPPQQVAPPSRDYTPPPRDYTPPPRDYTPPPRQYTPPPAPPPRDPSPPPRTATPRTEPETRSRPASPPPEPAAKPSPPPSPPPAPTTKPDPPARTAKPRPPSGG